jgi:hypothetical protein
MGWLDGSSRTVAKQGIPDGSQGFMSVPAFGASRPNLNGILEPDGSFESFARHGYSRNELVYACIAEKAQSLPQSVLRVYPTGSNEPIDDHRLRRLIEAPNPLATEFEMCELLATVCRPGCGLCARIWWVCCPLRGTRTCSRGPTGPTRSAPIRRWSSPART